MILLVNKMECFTVYADEIEGRIDPSFYRPEFIEIERKLNEMTHLKLGDISKRSKKGIFYILAEEYASEGVPFIRISNLKNGTVVSDKLTFITEEKNTQHKVTEFHTNDILISKTGNLAISIIPEEYKKCNISQDIIGIEVDEKYNPKYIAIFLNSNFGLNQLQRILQGQVQPHLTIGLVREIKIPDINSKTQNRLVELIENAQSLKKSKEAEAQRLLNSINDFVLDELGIKLPKLEDKHCYVVHVDELEGRIDPHFYMPEFRDLKNELAKLNHKALSDLVSFSNETWNQEDFFENEFPYIEISEIDISFGEIQNITYYEKNKAPSRAKMIVRENDIIVSTTRPHRGAIAIIDKNKNGFIASTGFAVLRNPKEEINRNYLLFYLRTQLSLKQMLQRSSGGNYPAINSGELKKLIVPIPSLETQNKIAEEVKRRMQKAEQLQKEAKEELEIAKQEVDKMILGDN